MSADIPDLTLHQPSAKWGLNTDMSDSPYTTDTRFSFDVECYFVPVTRPQKIRQRVVFIGNLGI